MLARLNPNSRRIINTQGLRVAGYGCTSVLLGALLAARDYCGSLVGVILGCIVAGTAVGSLVFGRRRQQSDPDTMKDHTSPMQQSAYACRFAG